MCYEALRAAGRRVGLYTSPHLVDVRERMIVDGRAIPGPAFAEWTDTLQADIEATDASFFEATTAIAFADLAARGAEIAVIEVGLGGRLDATNVLAPLVSVVTRIAREHVEYLGESLEGIAREKAGIAKPGVPFVIGEEDDHLATVLADVAAERHAVVRRVPPGERYGGPLTLGGAHQTRNAAIAVATLQALPDRWRPSATDTAGGLARARLPGRFDRRGRWVFDVAHNPDGMATLVAALGAAAPPRPIHALVGILREKAWDQMLDLLDRAVDRLWVTVPPTAPPERRWLLDQVRAAAPRAVVEPDFDRALAQVQVGAATVVVTGSFHTVGDAMARLPGFRPLG
jgi:dihydrofolate synthase/folylpolyglutamate synthase